MLAGCPRCTIRVVTFALQNTQVPTDAVQVAYTRASDLRAACQTQARETLRAVAKRDPEDVDSLIELAEATELEAPAEALAAYEAAIALLRAAQASGAGGAGPPAALLNNAAVRHKPERA